MSQSGRPSPVACFVTGEERQPPVRDLHAGQSVHDAATFAQGSRGVACPTDGKRRRNARNMPGKPAQSEAPATPTLEKHSRLDLIALLVQRFLKLPPLATLLGRSHTPFACGTKKVPQSTEKTKTSSALHPTRTRRSAKYCMPPRFWTFAVTVSRGVIATRYFMQSPT